MATRSYTLRSRAAAGTAGATPNPIGSMSGVGQSLPPDTAPPYYVTDDEARAWYSGSEGGQRRSYSDVVASRPSSPVISRVETVVPPVEQDPHEAHESNPVVVDHNPIVDPTNHRARVETEVSSSEDENPEPWTTVNRHRSHDKRAKNAKTQSSRGERHGKSAQRARSLEDHVVKQATDKLTAEEQAKISRRYDRLRYTPAQRDDSPARRSDSSVSRGEGPSNLKGKAVDPREWGANAGLSDNELDVEAQRAALESLRPISGENKSHHKSKKRRSKKQNVKKEHDSLPHDDKGTSLLAPQVQPTPRKTKTLPATARPVAQIPAKSYLGVALDKLDRESSKKSKGKYHQQGKPSSSESSSDSGDSETTSHHGGTTPTPSGSDSSASSDSQSDRSPISSTRSRKSDRHQRRHRSHHRSRKNRHVTKSRRRSRSSRSRRTYKAFKPRMYDGTPDYRVYNRFLREGSAYVQDLDLEPERYAYALSCFMKDRAYDFYIQKVSMNEEEWSLPEFF
ncbi:hypothetical protein NLJ89_g4475 [Agrocybe chaxingu]|uniref:Uncharacterized protein n=1 Tax=Agrocybe chaxingu TaxID=84603 RepID=A0A9W8MVX6_9AGAR|nr:hypothetical protein NLJ89_g4475 [Agrocybe chaxingu]